MSNITSNFLSIFQSPSNTLLEIEHTENALRTWLLKQGTEILPDSLLIAASVLFGSVDPHDLISLIDMSLVEIAMEIQLQQEDNMTVLPVQRGRCLMEERMYRAQMEVSLFSKAMANLCETLNTTTSSIESPTSCLAPKMLPVDAVYVESCQALSSANFNCFPATQYKCMAWLSACRKASLLASSHLHHTAGVGNTANQTLHDSSQHPNLHETLFKPGDRIFNLPGYLKHLVDDVAYRAYLSASVAESNKSLVYPDNRGSFKAESKTLDELKIEFRIMYLKKQRAQAEVDMFAEAIARIAIDGMSAGSTTTFKSRSPDHADDWFDDWHSTSSLSSSASGLP
ncbi:hypothetical protein CY34DRAFT_18299 [Suillus luteus UH-Slu-Lm8-n1]|uniref:Uncharacterized protein n=1 Tax=Suillus luteus UH-Slu-Lm8-n1 TaxID=930992 RepID=A0A0C9Z7R0_9AGAM|nr:hypothetical protein CY34DRAFT_18299 [Suillus luteus UH-Slu-Lm8-n1]